MMLQSIRLTLEPPSWQEPWGPFYFRKGSYGEMKVYTEDKDLILSSKWPNFGYLVSAESLKHTLILKQSNTAAFTKLILLEKELTLFTEDFKNLYEHNLVVEQQAESWKWAAVGESGLVGVLLLLLVLL